MTTTKIIGPNGGADYATPALWFASFAATLTDDQVGNFQNAEVVVTANQTLTGITVAGHTIVMTTGTGNSFADNVNKLTNALRYNASNGAGLRMSSTGSILLDIDVANFTLSKIQVKQDTQYSAAIRFTSNCLSGLIDQVIVAMANTNMYGLRMGGGGTVKNTLVYSTATGTIGIQNDSDNNAFQDVTVPNSSAGTASIGFKQFYGAPTLKNVAVAGWATDYSGTAGTCANNATDQGAFGGTNYGTSGQVSLVQATEFQNASTGTNDYRVNSSTSVKLKGNGTATGTPATDIVGTTRAAPPTIGAWDVGAAAPAASAAILQGFP